MARPWTAGVSASVMVVWLALGAPPPTVAQSDDTLPPRDVGQATLFGRAPDGRYAPVPLRHTAVELDVRGLVVAGTVTQQYVNEGDQPLQAVYVFPLPHEAAVYDMEIRVGDRVIRSVIQEREEARRTYETARAEGRRAALVEQERPNVFTASVANLMPRDRVDVRIRYVEALRLQDGRVRLTFPMVVGPRYVPGRPSGGTSGTGVAPDTDAVPDASRITPPLRAPGTRPGHDLSLHVSLDPGVAVTEVSSPSHPVTVAAQAGGRHEVRLASGTTLPNRDFVLEYAPAPSAHPEAALFLSRADGEAHALLVAFPPARDDAQPRLPVEMLFVIDVSGSMSGTSMEQARTALLQGLDRLQAGDRFNIVAYSHTFTSFAPVPLPVDEAALEAARRFVRGLDADGGTEMLPALEHTMAMPAGPGLVRQVVLLTDGCLGNEDQIFTALEKRLGAARLFTVAIGSAPNHHLATRMAEYGRGEFTHIADVSEVAARMGRLLDAMERPALADLSVSVIGAAMTDLHPARLPDLFHGRPLLLYGRMQADARGTLRLEGRRGTERYVEEIVFDAGQATFHPGVTTMWARQRIAERMDDWRRAGEEERPALRAEIVKEAIAYRLVTQFTSLVAVEERVVNPEGGDRTAAVPTELPAGWDAAKWFGAAPASGTADDFLALAALLLLAGGALLAALRARDRALVRG